MAIKRRETMDGVRYDVQWRLPDRSKRKKTFRTEREARQFEAKLVTNSAAGVKVDPRGGKIQLRTVYRSWLASRPDLSAKVRRGYEDNWRLRIQPHFGNWPARRTGSGRSTGKRRSPKSAATRCGCTISATPTPRYPAGPAPTFGCCRKLWGTRPLPSRPTLAQIFSMTNSTT